MPDAAPAQLYLERLSADSGSPGVSAAVMVNGQVVFSGGVGVANIESQEPQTTSTVHNIGSLSKIQAVVAVMQLVERGKVKLDAEIQDYAPWFPRKPQPITVRQLLTHTSGIRHYKQNDFGPDGLNALILKSRPRPFDSLNAESIDPIIAAAQFLLPRLYVKPSTVSNAAKVAPCSRLRKL